MTAHSARWMLVAALALGIVGDQLLSLPELGLGATLWVLLLALVSWRVGALSSAPDDVAVDGRHDRLVLQLILASSSVGFIFRDAEPLLFFAVVLGVGASGLLVWRAQGSSLRALRLRDAAVTGALVAGAVIAGAPRLAAKDAQLGDAASPTRRRIWFATIGLVASIPVITVTALLLGQADPAFGRLVESVIAFFSEDLIEHLTVSMALAWIVGGWLRGLSTREGAVIRFDQFGTFKLPMTALAPTLYGLLLVLAAYLGLQVRTLFGGAEFVRATAGLSYANYARHGFFELVAVTMIVLVVLTLADAVLERREARDEDRFRAAGWMLLLLTAVLAVSAVHRMSVYVQMFGLSSDRVLALAVMLGISTTLVWFGVSVLRGRREVFVRGLCAISVVWVLALHAVNPDALVARVNLSGSRALARFDVPYHAKLSADALPVLLARSGDLPEASCRLLLDGLRDVWRVRDEGTSAGWRTWTLPRARVKRMLASSTDELAAEHCVHAEGGR